MLPEGRRERRGHQKLFVLSTGDYVVDPGGLLRQDFHLRAGFQLVSRRAASSSPDTMIWLAALPWMLFPFKFTLAELAMSIPYLFQKIRLFSIVSGP